MNDFFKRVVLIASGTLLLLLGTVSSVHAQTTLGLQLKPAVVEDQVNPGEAHQYSISVSNVSKVAGNFYISAQDIKGVDDQGRPVFSNQGEVTGYELTSWITLPQSTLSLNAGETKTISFSVKIPSDASPGSHFASVFFSDKPIAPTTSGTGVGFNVGSIVSLRISGDIREEALLQEFSTSKLIYATANVDFRTKVQNLGNVLVQPTGIIQVTNMFGREVAKVPVNTSLASVFPKSSRTYPSTWKSDGFEFGRYQAIVSLVYGTDARKTIYSTTSFWVLPLVPILIVLGVLFGIVLLVYLLMKSFIRNKLRGMGVPNATRADTDFYKKKYQKSSSRLIVVAMAVLLACLVFLVLMFVIFA